MKFDWQWPAAVVFAVVFATLGALVALGKIHVEALLAMLTWLAPGPWQPKPVSQGGSVTSTTTTEVVAPSPPAVVR